MQVAEKSTEAMARILMAIGLQKPLSLELFFHHYVVEESSSLPHPDLVIETAQERAVRNEGGDTEPEIRSL